MEENVEVKPASTSTRSVGIKWGLIGAGIGIALFIVYNLLKVDFTSGPLSWLSYVFIVAFIFLAQKQFKDTGDGFMSFGQGMGVTFWYGLISSAASSVFTYVYLKFVDGSMIDTIRQKQMEAMQEKGNMSEEQIDQAMEIAGKFTTPEMMLVFGLFGGVIMVLIIGLLVTLFTQKKNPEAIV